MINGKKMLVVSAHAADYVWRAGGTIAKYIKHGAEVHLVVLSFGDRGESNDLRISALLRRSNIANEHKLHAGNTVLDYDALTVTCGGVTHELPNKEFMLLFKLLSYQNKIFTRRQLMDELWDMETETDERTIDVHINRLRERFRDNEDFEIVTVRGLGYKAVLKQH